MLLPFMSYFLQAGGGGRVVWCWNSARFSRWSLLATVVHSSFVLAFYSTAPPLPPPPLFLIVVVAGMPSFILSSALSPRLLLVGHRIPERNSFVSAKTLATMSGNNGAVYFLFIFICSIIVHLFCDLFFPVRKRARSFHAVPP